MVAFASDWRVSGRHAMAPLSPATIVMRYKQVMCTANRSEMPHGVTLREMLKAVVTGEDAASGVVALEDDLTRFRSE